MKLDVVTILISIFISGLGFFLALILIWRFYLRRKELLWWAMAQLVLIAGIVLIVLRGIIPDEFSIILANLLLVSAYAFIWIGASIYSQKKPFFITIAIVLFLYFISLILFTPNIAVRIILYRLVSILFIIGFVISLLYKSKTSNRFPEIAAAASLTLDAVFKIVFIIIQFRVMYNLEPLQQNMIIGLNTLLNEIVLVFWGIAVFLMVFDKVIIQLKTAESSAVDSKNGLEVLLKEVHHRVKNNMSIVTSLLSMQESRIHDKIAAGALAEAGKRVYSMSLIYDKLYRTSGYKNLSVREYLEDLIRDVSGMFNNSNLITIRCEIDDFKLDSKKLFPLGILLNEIITNSYKYAFPDSERTIFPKIDVLVRKNNSGMVEVRIADNGIGFDRSLLKAEKKGFGLLLLDVLSSQIHAKIDLKNGAGTAYTITFPADENE